MSHQGRTTECLVSLVLDRSMVDKLTDQEDSSSLLITISVLLAPEKLAKASPNMAVQEELQKVKRIMRSIPRAPKKLQRI